VGSNAQPTIEGFWGGDTSEKGVITPLDGNAELTKVNKENWGRPKENGNKRRFQADGKQGKGLTLVNEKTKGV